MILEACHSIPVYACCAPVEGLVSIVEFAGVPTPENKGPETETGLQVGASKLFEDESI